MHLSALTVILPRATILFRTARLFCLVCGDFRVKSCNAHVYTTGWFDRAILDRGPWGNSEGTHLGNEMKLNLFNAANHNSSEK